MRIPRSHGDVLKVREQGRLEALKLLGQFFERAVGYFLAHHFAGWGNAKYHLPALPVGQRAQTATRAVFLCRGLFEFQRQRFACGDEGLEGNEVHGVAYSKLTLTL